MPPLAYLLTFTTYGTHLPGSAKGWVDSTNNIPGSPVQPGDPSRETHWRSRLIESPFLLDEQSRWLTLHAILGVCGYRKWPAHAIHVRTSHIHAAVSGEVQPERILSDFKAYTTRALGSEMRKRYWTKHGSTRYLWNDASCKAAIEYVLNGQGVKMACYPDPEFHVW